MLICAKLMSYLYYFLQLHITFGCQDINNRYKTEFSIQGDYVIAGLFSVHNKVASAFSTPQVDICDSATFNSRGYHLFQAMRFGIEEINNSSSLLPDVTLGYDIFDTCSDTANLYGTLKILAQCTKPYIKIQNNFTLYNTKTIALIGPASSNFAFMTASILGKFLMPQISYSATNELLSLKQIYPSFLRTIPSDKLQVEVMLQLLLRFNWTWIAIVGSDDVYGRNGLQSLYSLVVNHGICVAYQGLIPYNMNRTEVRQLIGSIIQSRVKVTVVFSTYVLAKTFFEEVVQANVTDMVWVASESWSADSKISGIPNIKRIGSVLGVSVQQISLPKLLDFEYNYVNSLRVGSSNQYGCNQVCYECQTFTTQNMSMPSYSDVSASFNVYSAVYAIAHGLHELLNCTTGPCSKDNVYPWQLLEQVKKANFFLYNQSIQFDNNGNPATGYDIIMWIWNEDNPLHKVIGSYSQSQKQLQLISVLKWHTKNNTVPISICSKECGKGERRVQMGTHSCCFQCIPCPKMTFLNRSDLYSCQQCGYHQWSPARSEICYNRTTEYLSWTDPISVILLVIITLMLILTLAIALVFTIHLKTPVVKSAGGRMCLVMLISLASSCCTLYCYFGKPNKAICMLRQPVFAVSFTVCFSCIVVHSFQIVCIFKMATHFPKMYEMWVKKKGSNIFIIVSSAGQILISAIWIAVRPPEPIENISIFEDQIIFTCSESDSLGSVIEIVYIGILSIFCFVFCYMGKDLPKNYNEAKCISFSLLVYFFSWIGFFTTYIIYKGKYIAAVNVTSVLASVFGILGGYFTPKCYIILFRRELNTTEHFQTAIQNYTKTLSGQ